MTVRGEWLDAARAIYIVRYQLNWQVDDFWHAITLCHDAINTAGVETRVIHHLADILILPPGSLSLVFPLQKQQPHYVTDQYVIGGGTMARVVYRIVCRVTPRVIEKLHFVASLEMAR